MKATVAGQAPVIQDGNPSHDLRNCPPKDGETPCCFFPFLSLSPLAPWQSSWGTGWAEAEVETKAFDFCPEVQEWDGRDWELGSFRETGNREDLKKNDRMKFLNMNSWASAELRRDDLTLVSTPEFRGGNQQDRILPESQTRLMRHTFSVNSDRTTEALKTELTVGPQPQKAGMNLQPKANQADF